jgi:hypothetical protein
VICLIFVIAMIKAKKTFRSQKSQSGQCGSKQTVELKPRKKRGKPCEAVRAGKQNNDY